MGVIIYDMMVMIKRRAWRLDAMIMKKLQRAPSHETNLLESSSTNIIRMCKTIQAAFQRDRVLRCALFHTSTRYINRLWALEITRKKDFIVQPILITIENLPRLYYKGRFSGQV